MLMNIFCSSILYIALNKILATEMSVKRDAHIGTSYMENRRKNQFMKRWFGRKNNSEQYNERHLNDQSDKISTSPEIKSSSFISL